MPAEITMGVNGAEMMYVGETPWHGVGTKLDTPATAKEAIEAAHLDWEVSMQPIYIKREDGFQEISDKKAIVRTDTGKIFNVFTNQYTPVQNSESFKFFDGVVGAGEAIYHTAGSLKGGRRVWILAKLNGALKVSQDVLDKYILLVNSHDGTLALTMKMTAVRVVCNNTLQTALGGGRKDTFYSRHTPQIISKVTDARTILGLADVYFENLMMGINRLVEKQMNQTALDGFVSELFVRQEGGRQDALTQHSISETVKLFESGRGNDVIGVRGTAWAALNAVTEYVDHVKPVGRNLATAGARNVVVDDKRLHSAWFGTGSDIKQRAWDILQRISAN